MIERSLPILVAGLALSGAAQAHAAAPVCNLPQTTPVPRPYGPSAKDPVRKVPIVYYSLSASWSPQYCRDSRGMGGTFSKTFQCDRATNQFGFVLHGLWPDGQGKSWPQYCRPANLLSARTVRANLCMTPSADLLQHEWAKHGTCMSRTPDDYFGAARKAYAQIRFPDMTELAHREGLTVGDFTQAFLDANKGGPRGISRRAVQIALTDEGWLSEVRVCMNRRRHFAPCPTDNGGDVASSKMMRIWLPQ